MSQLHPVVSVIKLFSLSLMLTTIKLECLSIAKKFRLESKNSKLPLDYLSETSVIKKKVSLHWHPVGHVIKLFFSSMMLKTNKLECFAIARIFSL
jgi:hypothetical protein